MADCFAETDTLCPFGAAQLLSRQNPSVDSLSLQLSSGLCHFNSALDTNKFIRKLFILGPTARCFEDEPDEGMEFLIDYLRTCQTLQVVALADFAFHPRLQAEMVKAVAENSHIEIIQLSLEPTTSEIVHLFEHSQAYFLDVNFPDRRLQGAYYTDVFNAIQRNKHVKWIRFGYETDPTVVAACIDGLNVDTIEHISLECMDETIAVALRNHWNRREFPLQKLSFDSVKENFNSYHLGVCLESSKVQELILSQCDPDESATRFLVETWKSDATLKALDVHTNTLSPKTITTKGIARLLSNLETLVLRGTQAETLHFILKAVAPSNIKTLEVYDASRDIAICLFHVVSESKTLEHVTLVVDDKYCDRDLEEHAFNCLRTNRSLRSCEWRFTSEMEVARRNRRLFGIRCLMERNLKLSCVLKDAVASTTVAPILAAPASLIPTLLKASGEWGTDDITISLMSLGEHIGPKIVCPTRKRKYDVVDQPRRAAIISSKRMALRELTR